MFNNTLIATIQKIMEEFYKKGFSTPRCNTVMDDNKYKNELENAIDMYMKNRNNSTSNSLSIIGYIFQLLMPLIIIAFNHSFRNPFMYKKNEEEVTCLRIAFVNESYEVFLKALGDIVKKPLGLPEMRERLIGIAFYRFSSFSYTGTVDTELPDYHCNISPGEKNILDIEERFEEVYGRTGTDEELAAFAGCRVSTIKRNRASINTKMTVSLDMEVGDSDNEHTLGDCIPCRYHDYQPEKVIDDLLNAEIDDEMKKVLTEREYRRIRTRIDNDDMSEMKMAEEEIGINSDVKRLRAAQRSINRDLTSAKIKLRVIMEQYKEDIL